MCVCTHTEPQRWGKTMPIAWSICKQPPRSSFRRADGGGISAGVGSDCSGKGDPRDRESSGESPVCSVTHRKPQIPPSFRQTVVPADLKHPAETPEWDEHCLSPRGGRSRKCQWAFLEITDPLKTTESWKRPPKSSSPTSNQIPLCPMNHKGK